MEDGPLHAVRLRIHGALQRWGLSRVCHRQRHGVGRNPRRGGEAVGAAFSECTRKPGVPFAEGSRLATAALHVDHRAGQPSGHGTAKSAPKCGMKAAAESVSEGARAARSSVDGSTFAGAPTPHGREFRPADRQLGHLRISRLLGNNSWPLPGINRTREGSYT